MELKDLVGEHELSGVDFGDLPADYDACRYESANTMTFVLDGKGYCVTEDPSDGYRSSLRDIAEVPAESVKNVFTPCRVVGRHRTTRDPTYGGSCDILELIDVVTGKVVLEAGTDNDDDYYPSYVGNFTPAHMAVNQGTSVPAVATPPEKG